MTKQKQLNIRTHGQEWSREELAMAKAFVKAHASKRDAARQLKNELLSVQYQMESYVQDEDTGVKSMIGIEEFLNAYLQVLGLTFKKFALAIDTTDGNLKKYLCGDRKFSIDLAFRFASFFHNSPDVWLKVAMKNELLNLKKEKKHLARYRKYNYETLLREA